MKSWISQHIENIVISLFLIIAASCVSFALYDTWPSEPAMVDMSCYVGGGQKLTYQVPQNTAIEAQHSGMYIKFYDSKQGKTTIVVPLGSATCVLTK